MDLQETIFSVVEDIGPSILRVDGRRGYALSGVAYAPDLVLSTNRAAERDDELRVGLGDGEAVSAALVGRDPATDLALLRVQESRLSPIRWADAGELRVGQFALRAARGDAGLRVTLGVIGGVGPAWQSPWGGRLEQRVLSDAATFRGFSGGPLLTLAGEAVGLGSAALNRRGDALIPARTAQRVAEALLAHGRVRRGYLGISGQSVRLPSGQGAGVLLVSVAPESPAASAGLTLGDTLLELGGEQVQHPGQLIGHLDDDSVGQVLPLKLLRGGAVIEVEVTVGVQP